MTPVELEQVRKMIDAAVEKTVMRVIQPLREDIDRLKETDKRHSGTHREIATDVRKVQSETDHKVGDTANAIAFRDRAIADALAKLGDRLDLVESQSIRPGTLAAQGAQTAAVAAKDATTTIAVGQVQTDAAIRKNRNEGRLRTVAVIIGLIITTILNHYR